jgi:hypothetical protein
MYLATLDCATSTPSLSSSPRIRGRAPKRVVHAHLPDQRTQPSLDRRPASQRSRLPAPIAAKARAVPVDERLGTDDGQNRKDRRKPAVKHDQQLAILVRQPDTALEPASQDRCRSTAFSASSLIFDLIGAPPCFFRNLLHGSLWRTRPHLGRLLPWARISASVRSDPGAPVTIQGGPSGDGQPSRCMVAFPDSS